MHLPFEMKKSSLTYGALLAPGGVLGSIFAGYVPLASQNPSPIIVYSVANYRPYLSHFWANGLCLSCDFKNGIQNWSRVFNIKTTAGTIFNCESSYF